MSTPEAPIGPADEPAPEDSLIEDISAPQPDEEAEIDE
jgi:hypothetical protein